jgi:hypothetical protein
MPNRRSTKAEDERSNSNANLGQKDARREKTSKDKLGRMQNDAVSENRQQRRFKDRRHA